MSQATVISATARPSGGKGAARAVRREGKVPAVIYGGDEKTPEAIAVDGNEVFKIIQRGRFLSSVFELQVGDKKVRAIPRDVQLDPVRDSLVHLDFQRIGSDNRVRIKIPMRFINDALSPGLKRGGVLNIVRREIEVWAPADKIPEHFEANLEGLEIGRSIHISAVKLPEGVVPVIRDRDFTVATIAGAVKAEEETTTTAAAGDAAATPAAGDAKPGAPAADGKAAAPAAGGKAAPAAAAKPDAKGKK